MSKALKAFLAVISCFVALAVVAAAGLSAVTLVKVTALESAYAEEHPSGGVEGEDDIEISGGYWIRSTKAISDAYLSGDSSQLSDKDKETLDMASAIIDEIITDKMSDYDKEKAVFLWLHDNIGEDSEVTVLVRNDVTTDNPHGVLSSRQAVCVGYATTFRLFMQMLDVPCMVVHNTDLVHSWDLIQIDGHWYHADAYSAHGLKDPLQYLNLDDNLQAANGYSWDTSFYPAADSVEKCYLYENAEKTADVYSIPAKIKEGIENKAAFISLIFTDGEAAQPLAENLLNALEMKLPSSLEYQNCGLNHTVCLMPDKSALVYIQIFDYSKDGPYSEDITEEEQEKIDKAITDAFGELTEADYSDELYNGTYACPVG